MVSSLKVIELASVLAGPAVGMFFAELGASVTKIENKKTGGDVTRQWRLASESNEHPKSAYYCSINYNKKSLFLDLSLISDQQKVHKLIETADIVIANFKPGDDLKFNLDFNSLKRINPKLIYGSITAFGNESKRLGFDMVLQAESGFLYMTGHPNSPMSKMPVALIDVLAAHQLKEGILIALWEREITKKGKKVSVSLLDAAIASLANQATNWLMNQHIPQRMGTLHPNIAPYGELFKCADNKLLVLAIGNNRQFSECCSILGLNDIVNKPKFNSNSARVQNRPELQKLLESRIQSDVRDNWMGKFNANGVPAGAIRNMKEVFETQQASNLILESTTASGLQAKCVKTAIFKFEN